MSAPDGRSAKVGARDWRLEYVICQHVAEDQAKGERHSGFVVCCQQCYEAGFLRAPLRTNECDGGLCIGVMS